MWFVMLWKRNCRLVQAKATATVTDVNALAFGFNPSGDKRANETRCLGSSRSLAKARAIAAGAGHPVMEVA